MHLLRDVIVQPRSEPILAPNWRASSIILLQWGLCCWNMQHVAFSRRIFPNCTAVYNPHQEASFSTKPCFPSPPTVLRDLIDYFSLYSFVTFPLIKLWQPQSHKSDNFTAMTEIEVWKSIYFSEHYGSFQRMLHAKIKFFLNDLNYFLFHRRHRIFVLSTALL